MARARPAGGPPFGAKLPRRRTWPVPKTHAELVAEAQLLYTTEIFVSPTSPLAAPGPVPRTSDWWDPAYWLYKFGQVAVETVDDVKTWTLDAVHEAADLIHEDVVDVWGLAHNWLDDAVGYAERLGEHAWDGIQTAIHDGEHLFDRARHDAASLFDRARHDAAAAFDSARHEAAHLFDVARHDAAHELDALRHDTAHELDDVRSWAKRDLVAPVAHETALLWHAVVRDVWAKLDDAFHRLTKLEGDVYGEIMGAVHLVEEAGEWLVWMARHSVRDIEALYRLLERDTIGDWLAAEAKEHSS